MNELISFIEAKQQNLIGYSVTKKGFLKNINHVKDDELFLGMTFIINIY